MCILSSLLIKKEFSKAHDFIISGGNPNKIRPELGIPILHSFAMKCDEDAVKFLLEHGADPALKDNDGLTAREFTLSRLTKMPGFKVDDVINMANKLSY